MRRRRVLAVLGWSVAWILLGSMALIAVPAVALLLNFLPGPSYPVDLPLESPVVGQACAGEEARMIVAVNWRAEPLVEPLVERSLTRDHKSISAQYSGHRESHRFVSFDMLPGSVRVEVRFEDHGLVARRQESHVRFDGEDLCFDLSIGKKDAAMPFERWQGRLSLR